MRNFLESQLGKEVDLHCGGLAVSGKLVKVEGEVVQIQKDDIVCYVSIDKIIAVWESQDKKPQSPGFLSKTK